MDDSTIAVANSMVGKDATAYDQMLSAIIHGVVGMITRIAGYCLS
jgi:hypothetical protein